VGIGKRYGRMRQRAKQDETNFYQLTKNDMNDRNRRHRIHAAKK